MFSLLWSSSSLLPTHPTLVDTATGEAISFPAFLSQVYALADGLCSRIGLYRSDMAFMLV